MVVVCKTLWWLWCDEGRSRGDSVACDGDNDLIVMVVSVILVLMIVVLMAVLKIVVVDVVMRL